jgi:hypothetical protein
MSDFFFLKFFYAKLLNNFILLVALDITRVHFDQLNCGLDFPPFPRHLLIQIRGFVLTLLYPVLELELMLPFLATNHNRGICLELVNLMLKSIFNVLSVM